VSGAPHDPHFFGEGVGVLGGWGAAVFGDCDPDEIAARAGPGTESSPDSASIVGDGQSQWPS